MRDLNSTHQRLVRGLLIAAALLAATPTRADPWRTDRFCAPTALNWPTGLPNSTDGEVKGDLGYSQGYRFVFADGTHDVLAAVQAVKAGDNSKLWMSFEMFNASYDVNNFVVLAFDVGMSGNGPYKIFVVSPMQGNGQGGSATDPNQNHPTSVQYYTQAAGAIAPATWTTGTAPAGTVMGYAPSTDPITGNLGWQLEMELPVAALGLPTNRDFGMYLDLLPVDSTMGTTVEMRWPDGSSPAPAITRDINNLPQPDTWGRFSLASNTCTGVYLESWTGDIYTSIDNADGNNGTDLTYNPSRDNYFHATVHNDGLDASGVTASFKIANFGTSYDAWAPPVSLTGTPLVTTDGPASVSHSGTHTFRIGPWRLDATQVAQYKDTHQCILVELDSKVNGTAFRIKSAFQNADFDVASTVLTHAEINTKGLGPAPAGMAAHTFGYYVKPTFQYAYSDGRHEQIPIHKITSQLDMVFHAYHYIGNTITLRGTRYDIVEPGPGFSIIYQHSLPDVFANEFKKRHAQIDALARRALALNDADPKTKAARQSEIAGLYRQVNDMLAADTEHPKPSDWQLKFDGLNAVGNTRGFWYKTEVPANSVRRLSITATAGEQSLPGTGAQPGSGCGTRSGSKTTPSKVGTLGMFLAVGAVVFRRRRRR